MSRQAKSQKTELTRRGLLLGGGAISATCLGRPLWAAPLPVLPLSVGIAERDGSAVVSRAWLDRQVHEASHLMSPHGIFVRLARVRALPADSARLETADARDALAVHVEPQVINVFIVEELRDVDDPERLRMGVRWRQRRDVSKDYVIVASGAMFTTLTHELGHFFGNGHSQVTNNIMSYKRDDPSAVAFDPNQGAKMRQVARRLLVGGRLVAIDALDADEP